MPQWNDFLEVLKQSGCQRNAITPLQKLSEIRSNIYCSITIQNEAIVIITICRL